jgi:hypothetical protein
MSEVAAHWQGDTALAFVAHKVLLRSPCVSTHQVLMAGRREPDDNLIFSAISRVGDVISRPTPGFPSLSIGYPLALVSAVAVVPLPTALLLSAFFAGYAYLGRQVTGGEEDASKLDFAALTAAVASAGLLSPFGLWNGNGEGVVGLVALLGFGLAVSTLIEAAPSEDEKLFDEWDDKFDDE